MFRCFRLPLVLISVLAIFAGLCGTPTPTPPPAPPGPPGPPPPGPVTYDKVYVNVASTVANPDGSTPQKAFATIKEGVALAQQEAVKQGKTMTVEVAAGTYTLTTEKTDKDFAKDGPKVTTRPDAVLKLINVHDVILKGDSGAILDGEKKALHVVVIENTDGKPSGLTITGFQIQGGYTDIEKASSTEVLENLGNGAGLQITGAKGLKLDNLVVKNNLSHGDGAGLFARKAAEIDLSDVVFESNVQEVVTGEGGAIYLKSDEPGKLNCIKCTFSKNLANNKGGAVGVGQGGWVVKFVDSSFVENQNTGQNSGLGGGAIFMDVESVVDISGSTFSKNKALREGGAIMHWGAKLTITKSTFDANEALPRPSDGKYSYGGAISSKFVISGATINETYIDTATKFTNNKVNGNPGGQLWGAAIVVTRASATSGNLIFQGATDANPVIANFSGNDGGAEKNNDGINGIYSDAKIQYKP